MHTKIGSDFIPDGGVVELVGPVGGSDDEDPRLGGRLDAVERGKELRLHSG